MADNRTMTVYHFTTQTGGPFKTTRIAATGIESAVNSLYNAGLSPVECYHEYKGKRSKYPNSVFQRLCREIRLDRKNRTN